jgi:copper chaperone CopZ
MVTNNERYVTSMTDPLDKMPPSIELELYDREAAANVLADLTRTAIPADLGAYYEPVPALSYTSRPLAKGEDGLTTQQRGFLETQMSPEFEKSQVTSADRVMFWKDSVGTTCTGFYAEGDGALGPIIPIAAREVSIVLTRGLQNPDFQAALEALSEQDQAVLNSTTTDKQPVEIFRVGFTAAERAIAQYALLVHETPYATPQEFVNGLVASGVLRQIANRFPWETQTSTPWRQEVVGHLNTLSTDTVRLDIETTRSLSAMKARYTGEAVKIMHQAILGEGLTREEAFAKYHDQLDIAPATYMQLWEGSEHYDGSPTRCLGAMAIKQPDGSRAESVISFIEPKIAETFARVFADLEISETDSLGLADGVETEMENGRHLTTLHAPGISCQHCVNNITHNILPELMGVELSSVDLDTKVVTVIFDPDKLERSTITNALQANNYLIA